MDTGFTIESTTDFIFLYTIGALTIAMVVELFLPRRALKQALAWRWINNFALGVVTWFLTSFASTLAVFWLARWTEITEFGLFQHLTVPLPVAFMVMLLAGQFMTYILHVAFHKVPFLWPFHAVHHTDTDVDVSTAYRNHPLESIITLPFVAPVILLLGIPAQAAVAYQLFVIGMTVFGHSNIYLPAWLDRYLRMLIVTPDFHRMHHCADQQYTDSNYGGAIPWFDYLFKTATRAPFEKQKSITLGLEHLRDPSASRVDRLLGLPFIYRKLVRRSPAKPPVK